MRRFALGFDECRELRRRRPPCGSRGGSRRFRWRRSVACESFERLVDQRDEPGLVHLDSIPLVAAARIRQEAASTTRPRSVVAAALNVGTPRQEPAIPSPEHVTDDTDRLRARDCRQASAVSISSSPCCKAFQASVAHLIRTGNFDTLQCLEVRRRTPELGGEIAAVAVTFELGLVDRHQRFERADHLAYLGQRLALDVALIIEVEA